MSILQKASFKMPLLSSFVAKCIEKKKLIHNGKHLVLSIQQCKTIAEVLSFGCPHIVLILSLYCLLLFLFSLSFSLYITVFSTCLILILPIVGMMYMSNRIFLWITLRFYRIYHRSILWYLNHCLHSIHYSVTAIGVNK